MDDSLSFILPASGQTLQMKALTLRQTDRLHSAKKGGGEMSLIAKELIPQALGINFSEYKRFVEGDEMACIIALRRATWGDFYAYNVQCPECEHRHQVIVDLRTLETKMRPPNQPVRGLELEMYDDDGNRTWMFKVHLPTVSDRLRAEEEMVAYIRANRAKQSFERSFLVASRVDDIYRCSGDESETSIIGEMVDEDRRTAIREFFMDQSLSFINEFMTAFEEVSCGIDAEQEYECENFKCRHTWRGEMPVRDAFFSSTSPSSEQSKPKPKARVRKPWEKSSKKVEKDESSPPKIVSSKNSSEVENTDQAPSSDSSSSSSSTIRLPQHLP